MRARLKAKVLRWKSTAMRATKTRRLLQARLRRSQRRVAELENKVTALEAQAAPIPISGHIYPAQLIALAVFIVVLIALTAGGPNSRNRRALIWLLSSRRGRGCSA